MTNKLEHIATIYDRHGHEILFFYDSNHEREIVIDTHNWCVRRNFEWCYELPCYLKGEYGTIDIGYLTPEYEMEED